MTIEFQCDDCHKTLRTSDEKAGLSAKCPHCGKELSVPAAPPGEPVSHQAPTDGDGSLEPAAASQRPPTDFARDTPPPARPSPLADFENLTRSAPRPRPEPVQFACPLCGAMNESTTDRCLACGEPIEQFRTADRTNLSTRFGDVFGRAWELWSSNLGVMVGSAAITLGILWVVGMAQVTGLIYLQYGHLGTMGLGPAQQFQFGQPKTPQWMALQLLFSFITSLLYALFYFAFSHLTLDTVRRQASQLAALWPSSRSIASLLAGMLLYGLLITINGLPALLVTNYGAEWFDFDPGVEGMFDAMLITYSAVIISAIVSTIIVAFFWPAPFLFVDRQAGILGSVVKAPGMSMRFFSLSALLALVQCGLNFVGAAACSIGLIFTVPLSFMLFAVAYERCRISLQGTTTTKAPAEGLP